MVQDSTLQRDDTEAGNTHALPARVTTVPRWAAVVLAGALALGALGYWTYTHVEDSLREIRATTLRTLLDAHAVALRVTLEDRLDGVDAALRPARTMEIAERYVATGGRWGDTGQLAAFYRPRKAPGGAEHDVTMDPYANAQGVAVIGAWRWLPELGIGVQMEIAASEAYAPLRYLNIAFGVVFGALAIAVALALGAALSVLRLRREMGDVKRLGGYALHERIGEGGMAIVYRARHALLKRPCAVKLLRPARATDETMARFEREVQLVSQLTHPNVIEIYDYGRTADGQLYYAMELLDGINVAGLVGGAGALPVPRALHLLRQLCEGLAEAHGRGLVHRDVKPENIMVCRRGGEFDVVKILDFGLVKNLSEEHSRDLTRTLRILGTPLYMAPERLRNPADVDARADIYAVGAVAFYLLTGRRLFEAADDLALTTKVLNEEPPRVATVAAQPIPVELDLLVQACVEKRREDRPQRIGDLVEALRALSQEHRWTQREAQAWWETQPAQSGR